MSSFLLDCHKDLDYAGDGEGLGDLEGFVVDVQRVERGVDGWDDDDNGVGPQDPIEEQERLRVSLQGQGSQEIDHDGGDQKREPMEDFLFKQDLARLALGAGIEPDQDSQQNEASQEVGGQRQKDDYCEGKTGTHRLGRLFCDVYLQCLEQLLNQI